MSCNLLIILFYGFVFNVNAVLATEMSDSFPDTSLFLSQFPVEKSTQYRIDKIVVIGNNKTREETILREVQLNAGNLISEEQIKYFENRILSLGLFSDVNLFINQIDNENVLFIVVNEAWYIWPFPFVDIADRDWKKITYGLNLNIRNITGRNEVLTTGFSLGYDPKFYASYFNPYFDDKHNLFLKTQLQIQKRKNRSIIAISESGESYHEKIFLTELSLGKRLNLFNIISGSLLFQYLTIDSVAPNRTVSKNGIDRALSLQLSYSYDTRDLTAYPKQGTNFSVSFRKTGLGESVVDYSTAAFEIKKFFSIGFPILYFRNYSRILIGSTLPYYANSFLGYGERIRGYFNEIYESNSLTMNTLEMRLPLVERFIVEFDLPLIPKEIVTYNFGLDLHFFYDNALMMNKNQKFEESLNLHGFGFGFSLLFLPYRSLNIELAWNKKLNPQIIIDLNFPF